MIFSRPSVILLIAANLVPFLGVLFFGWNLFQILFLYWLESAVVGFYNIFKLIKVSGFLSILFVPFFIVHYGGFMAGHLVFLLALFAHELAPSSLFPSWDTMTMLLQNASIPLTFLFTSHGLSFTQNFLGKHEYEGKDTGDQMNAPYKRIILMHVTLLV